MFVYRDMIEAHAKHGASLVRLVENDEFTSTASADPADYWDSSDNDRFEGVLAIRIPENYALI